MTVRLACVLKHLCLLEWLNRHQCSGVHKALPYLSNMVENSENLVKYSCYFQSETATFQTEITENL